MLRRSASDEQNSLREHDFELILAFYENLIQEKTGCKMKEEMHDLLEMYCRSSVYMTVKWVLAEKDGRTRRTGRTDGRSDAGKTKRTV